MNYTQLLVVVSPKELGNDILIAELSEIGFESFVENEEGFEAYIQAKNFEKECVDNLFLKYQDNLTINYSENDIPKENWNNQWESNFEPIDVEEKCYIRAPFHAFKEKYLYDIIIEPKMSFGTGHHNTTQLMIQKLMELDVEKRSVLDMGCGTGVLAILASKMHASMIYAVDIDDWSFEN